MTATKTMSNAIARKYFLHANDQDANGQKACYFAENGTDDGWGFWVSADGDVTIDSTSANGREPNRSIVVACQRAAEKYLETP